MHSSQQHQLSRSLQNEKRSAGKKGMCLADHRNTGNPVQLKSKVNVNDDSSLEKEADVMGAKAVQHSGLQDNRTGLQKKSYVQGKTQTTVQLRPIAVSVTGISHLVRMNGKSIFRGQELPGEIVQGMTLVVETGGAKRSRRGPNQEHFHNEDEARGTHIYKWYRVLSGPHGPMPANVYVREDAIQMGAAPAVDALGQAPSIDAQPGVRTSFPRSREARAVDRLSRAFWIPMMEAGRRDRSFPPHLAAMVADGNVHLRGNLGDREIPAGTNWGQEFYRFVHTPGHLAGRGPAVAKRSKIKRKLRAQEQGRYPSGGGAVMDAVAAAVADPSRINLGPAEHREGTVHGEMRFHNEMTAVPALQRDPRGRRTRLAPQHIGGVLEDCLFCHWAHALFNKYEGGQRGVQLTTAGTHGHIPPRWTAPDWLMQNAEALAEFRAKLAELPAMYHVEMRGAQVRSTAEAGGELPPDSDSDIDEH